MMRDFRTEECALGSARAFGCSRDGRRIRNFRHAWESAGKRAGVHGRSLHDFRRTSVRNLERAGVSRSAALAIVGHKTDSIDRRYAIVDSATLREAADKIDMGTG
jgi:integrase